MLDPWLSRYPGVTAPRAAVRDYWGSMTGPSLVELRRRHRSDASPRITTVRGAHPAACELARWLADGDDRCVAGIRAGEAAAFEAMFRTHYEALRAFAASYVRDQATADEIVQDVLCWIWQHRDGWVVDTSLRTYLFSAIRHRALNHARRQRIADRWHRRAAADVLLRGDPHSAEPADARVTEDDFTRALRRAVDALPARCREAYTLRWLHHLSYREVAAEMGTSVKTAEIQIAKALKLLRQGLAEFFS